MRYRMAPGVELVQREGGTFLMSRTPMTLVRLNAPLVLLARRLFDGAVSAASAAEAAVLEQLALKGFLLRLQDTSRPEGELPGISVVIPVLDRAGELARCLQSIRRVNYPQDRIEVIVVDDGSSDDSAQVARSLGAQVVSSGGVRRGPAAARNVGAARATKELLAFIDSDCSASPEWLAELAPLFTNERIAAVGGLVDGMCSESVVDRYEAVMSSLSLGARERFGSGGDDTFYLPSCNMLVRRSLFLAVGGFESSMHVGEDVDLTWRLRDAGWTIAYLPAGRILHEHRSTVRSFMSRRFDYGTSEGTLQKLHPNRKKRFVLPPVLGLVLALSLAAPFAGWWSLAGAAALLAADVAVYRARLARRGVALGHLELLSGRLRAAGGLAYYLSYHLVRYYLPVLLLLPLWLPPFALLPLAAFLTCVGVDYRIKKPALSPLQFARVYLLEQAAYGTGVFWGCLRGRGFASYRVTILSRMEAAC